MSRGFKLTVTLILFLGGCVWWYCWFVSLPRVSQTTCLANSRQIEFETKFWSVENHKEDAAVPTWEDITGWNKNLRYQPVCPQGGTYFLGSVAVGPRCSLTGY